MADNTTSFWNFIKTHEIEIPIIQRDYAQGRLGKEYLRKSFLTNLKQALDNHLSHNDEVLKLDFVYGSVEHDKLQPLDGQQRLTTLWLLHWYIALRAGRLEEASERLKCFTYETRISSREFCNNLCNSEYFKAYTRNDSSIVSFITIRTWFFSAWKQDPTIQSMLRMLGGSISNDNHGEDNIDGIEKLFKNAEAEGFKRYWESLISQNAPIVFCHLPLEDFGLSDDLYIKMNARGKQLTAFENFKADLIGYMLEQAKENENEDWKKLLNVREGIPIKLDTIWTDIFWENRSEENHIDEIYYAFLNRFFWNELFIAKGHNGNEYRLNLGRGRLPNGKETHSIEIENPSYKYLNEDRYDTYNDLEPYKYDAAGIPLQLFENLETVLNRYSQYTSEIPKVEWAKEFNFIPKYESKAKVTTLNQIQRIIFFAVYKYFKEGEGDENSLRRWMRVVWNLVSGEGEDGNPQIRSTSAVRTAIEYIDKLKSHDVYASLRDQSTIASPSDFEYRWNEEIIKATQIVDDDGKLRLYGGTSIKDNGSQYETWEEIIIEAEKWAFFKGTIRFLFRSENKETNWSHFDGKWANVQKYFGKESGSNSVVNEGFRDAKLLRALISRFTPDNFWKVLWWSHKTFNNNPETWMYYLLNEEICDPIHQLLSENTNIKVKELKLSDDFETNECFAKNALYLLTHTGLLDFVMEKIPNAWIRNYHNHKAIFPSSTGVFLDTKQRDNFLLHTEGVTIDDCYKVNDKDDLLYGSDINFRYNEKNYQWHRDDFIYLMTDKETNSYRLKDETKMENTEKYYCFEVKGLNGDEIMIKLQATNQAL